MDAHEVPEPDDRPLPGFTSAGVLPVGIHDCSLDELYRNTCFNTYRQSQWLQLMGFMAWPVLNRKFSHAYIGGGFLTTKERPTDVDVVLETISPYGPDAFIAVSRFFASGLEAIEYIYGVHLQFWMKGAPAGLSDYRTFFQYGRPEAITPVLNPSRGIVRIDLLDPKIASEVRRHLRGDGPRQTSPPPEPPVSDLEREISRLSGLKKNVATLGLHSSRMLVVTNAQGRVEWVNPKFAENCGYDLQEIRGKKPGEILQGPGTERAVVEELRQAIRDGKKFECRLTKYRRDGSSYTARIELHPLFNGSVIEGFFAVEEDLGEVTAAKPAKSSRKAVS